ncbi:MAG: glycosyltransferase family 2 protein [Pseudohongiellaceae bacterium]
MDNTNEKASCAVIVTFNPDITSLLKLLGQLNKETDFVVIDNGSQKIGQFTESIKVYRRCVNLVRLPENVGLAQALNIGLEYAVEQSYRFAFLFDQDSSLCDLYVNRMLTAYDDIAKLSAKPVAALGPRIINPQTRKQTRFKLFNRLMWRTDRHFMNTRLHFEADFLITSGTLIPLHVLPKTGMMKSSYFIDNVDMEWCFRAKAKGFELAGTDQAVLYHAIGERSTNPLVRSGVMALHNPSRIYYSSRNRVHLYSVPYSPLGWKVRDCIRFFVKASWLLVSSGQRKQYWRNISAGIRDAKTLG